MNPSFRWCEIRGLKLLLQAITKTRLYVDLASMSYKLYIPSSSQEIRKPKDREDWKGGRNRPHQQSDTRFTNLRDGKALILYLPAPHLITCLLPDELFRKEKGLFIQKVRLTPLCSHNF